MLWLEQTRGRAVQLGWDKGPSAVARTDEGPSSAARMG